MPGAFDNLSKMFSELAAVSDPRQVRLLHAIAEELANMDTGASPVCAITAPGELSAGANDTGGVGYRLVLVPNA